MKALSKWNVPLGLPEVIAFCSLPCVLMFVWIFFLDPYLSALLASQEHFADASPFIYDIVHAMIGFMILPWSFGPLVIALYFYQRHYDRKTERKDT